MSGSLGGSWGGGCALTGLLLSGLCGLLDLARSTTCSGGTLRLDIRSEAGLTITPFKFTLLFVTRKLYKATHEMRAVIKLLQKKHVNNYFNFTLYGWDYPHTAV